MALRIFIRVLILVLVLGFSGGSRAQTLESQPGLLLSVSPESYLFGLRGVQVFPEDPFHLSFLLEEGGRSSAESGDSAVGDNARRLASYFMAALTIPDGDLWVNLNPLQPDRIVPLALGETLMGRDLLEQDYLLKQRAARILDPEAEVGGRFWTRVRQEALRRHGMAELPFETFYRVWVVPATALVYENRDRAFVVESHLTVMLETDYAQRGGAVMATVDPLSEESGSDFLQELTRNALREVVIPELEKEVNEAIDFAPLRQIYHAVILAEWYKRNLARSPLAELYIGRSKTRGIDDNDPDMAGRLWEGYLRSMQEGAFDRVRDEYDPSRGDMVARKYVSGGIKVGGDFSVSLTRDANLAMLSLSGDIVRVDFQIDAKSSSFNDDRKLAVLSVNEPVGREFRRLPGYKFLDDGRLEYIAPQRQEQMEKVFAVSDWKRILQMQYGAIGMVTGSTTYLPQESSFQWAGDLDIFVFTFDLELADQLRREAYEFYSGQKTMGEDFLTEVKVYNEFAKLLSPTALLLNPEVIESSPMGWITREQLLNVWQIHYKDMWKKLNLVSPGFKDLKRIYYLSVMRGLDHQFHWILEMLPRQQVWTRNRLSFAQIFQIYRTLHPNRGSLIFDLWKNFGVEPRDAAMVSLKPFGFSGLTVQQRAVNRVAAHLDDTVMSHPGGIDLNVVRDRMGSVFPGEDEFRFEVDADFVERYRRVSEWIPVILGAEPDPLGEDFFSSGLSAY